jgi:TRAP-type C4-dicarboxylate transport system permease small subunit
MKALTIVGSILMALGIAGMIWGGIEYFDNRSSIEIGDTNITIEQDLPPIAIGGAIAAGVGLLAIGVGAMGRGRKN